MAFAIPGWILFGTSGARLRVRPSEGAASSYGVTAAVAPLREGGMGVVSFRF